MEHYQSLTVLSGALLKQCEIILKEHKIKGIHYLAKQSNKPVHKDE